LGTGPSGVGRRDGALGVVPEVLMIGGDLCEHRQEAVLQVWDRAGDRCRMFRDRLVGENRCSRSGPPVCGSKQWHRYSESGGALRGRPRYDGNADTLLASLGLIQKTAGTILAAIARAETNAAEDTRPMMN
jgi:hypothetical protein